MRVEEFGRAVIAEYYYDPFGRRLWKEVDGARTYFLYSDEGLIGEYDAAGVEIKAYGWKPGSTWCTDPLFMKIGSDYCFFHNDHIGTPQKLTTASGAVVWRATYSSFGKASVDVETVINNLRFAGQYYDSENELHYNYNRYYDSQLGIYPKVDPIGLKGGINMFVYARNNPIRFIDYLGLWCGSGWTELIVPDKPAGYDFSDCCRKHDHCYGGELDDDGNSQCDRLQEDCDKDFLSCMLKVCEKENSDGLTQHLKHSPDSQYVGQSRTECERIAKDYYRAVRLLGQGPYNRGRENSSCECK